VREVLHFEGRVKDLLTFIATATQDVAAQDPVGVIVYEDRNRVVVGMVDVSAFAQMQVAGGDRR
jgi:uncharacterized protein (DUF302 family)